MRADLGLDFRTMGGCAVALSVLLLGCTDAGSAAGPASFEHCGSPICHLAGLCYKDKELGCIARSDADCAQSTICLEDGRCQKTANFLCGHRATSDCASAMVCQALGWCAPHKGECQAVSDAYCRASEACKRYGNCSFYETPDGLRLCKPMLTSDCLASDDCKNLGWCAAGKDGYCDTVDDAMCQQSQVCKLSGQCTAAGGLCVLPPGSDCAKTPGCLELGLCQTSDDGRRCYVHSTADCANTKVCKEQGKCFYSDGTFACETKAPVWPPNW